MLIYLLVKIKHILAIMHIGAFAHSLEHSRVHSLGQYGVPFILQCILKSILQGIFEYVAFSRAFSRVFLRMGGSRVFLFFFKLLQSDKFITKAVGELGVGWLGDIGCLGCTIEKDSQSARRANRSHQRQAGLHTVGL